jgi:hypothetical protein
LGRPFHCTSYPSVSAPVGTQGCRGADGGDASERATPALIATAQQASANVTSATAATTMTISGGPVALTETGNLAIQLHPPLASVGETVIADGQSLSVTEVIARSGVYLKLPAPFLNPGHRPWIDVGVGNVGAGVFAELLSSSEDLNPIAQSLLSLAGRHLHATGYRTIAGADTSGYAGWYSPQASLQNLPASERAQAAAGASLLSGNVDFSVWIDGNGQVKQFTESGHIAIGISGLPTLGFTVRYTVTSVNQPVNISVPPPSQVFTPSASQLNGTAL